MVHGRWIQTGGELHGNNDMIIISVMGSIVVKLMGVL